MHHQVPVRVMHGVAHVAEESETLLDREPVRIAVAVHRDAVHVLHHEIRQPRFGDAGVEETRDVRVVEATEDAPLQQEPAQVLG